DYSDEDYALTLGQLMEDPFVGSETRTNEDENEDFYLLSENNDDESRLSDVCDDSIDACPLYPDANISIGAFMLLIAIFCSKYNLIGDGIQQLLQIIALALPSGHNLCTTLHAFKMYFKNLKNPLVKHHYCAQCLAYCSSNNTVCPVCTKVMDKSNKRYFLEIPIENQLKNLFAQKGFYDRLQDRHKKKFNGIYEDIYHGTLYRNLFDNDGPLSSLDNLSFVLNTDGAPVFKSSKVSIWPIYLVINELPYKLRMRKENMILAALWFGNQKPAMGTFLKPLKKSFDVLHSGIICSSPERGEFNCKCYLLAATADLPARSLLCNSVQFNGKFGCWKCTQPGETAAVGKGHAHVFPFQIIDPKGPCRTADSVEKDADKTVKNYREKVRNPIVQGVKGPSWISYFPGFHCVQGIAIDYMHGVLLGVQKLLLTLWFSPKHKAKCFSVSTKTDTISSRLERIRPTLDITRLPRSIADMKYWKASEYRSFLLFYGAPVLHGILDHERFNHYLCLINAIHILLGHGSSERDIDRAERMLMNFCGKFEDLYSRSFMTLNMHQLVHLADGVRCLGPLYTHSCFPFEDKNGIVLKMIRGTQNIDNQIITGISFIQKIPELKQRFIEPDSVMESLCNEIENPYSVQRTEKIGDDTYILGAVKKRRLTDTEFNSMCAFTGNVICNNTVDSFMRLEKRSYLIYGLDYGRMIKRDNSTVMYKVRDELKFGSVCWFCKLTEPHLKTPIAFLQELSCPCFDTNSNILSVNKTNNLTVVKVSDIILMCMLVEVDQKLFICKFPNKLECD
ncbi:hypothetical protein FSP39_010520, partial [Pinctada imbricata]